MFHAQKQWPSKFHIKFRNTKPPPPHSGIFPKKQFFYCFPKQSWIEISDVKVDILFYLQRRVELANKQSGSPRFWVLRVPGATTTTTTTTTTEAMMIIMILIDNKKKLDKKEMKMMLICFR